jgi:hypothetical protein
MVRVRFSATSKTERLLDAFDRRSHPASPKVAPLTPTEARNWRLLTRGSGFIAILPNSVSASHHGNHIVKKAGDQHHNNMDEDESYEIGGGEKVNGPRRLTPANQRQQKWKRCVNSRRHRQTREHKNEQDDEDGEIGDFLQYVVTERFVAFGKSQPEMLPKGQRKRTPFAGRR